MASVKKSFFLSKSAEKHDLSVKCDLLRSLPRIKFKMFLQGFFCVSRDSLFFPKNHL